MRNVFLAAVALATAAIAPLAHADTAKDFNLFVLGNMTSSGSDTEGRLAVGGKATLSSYSVGLYNHSGTNLVVGGDLVTGSGNTNGGAAVVGGAFSGPFTIGGGVTQHVPAASLPVNFTSEATRLNALSDNLATYASVGTWTSQYGGLTLNGTSSGLNVFNLSAASVAGLNSATINLAAGATALINVEGNFDFHYAGMSLNGGATANDLLWNFYDASSINLYGVGFLGSILAPEATMKSTGAGSGHIDGQVIVAAFDAPLQINNFRFSGNLLNPPTLLAPPTGAVPEPATWALMIGGFGMAGAMLRRQRRLARAA